jgi:hypothetical protein
MQQLRLTPDRRCADSRIGRQRRPDFGALLDPIFIRQDQRIARILALHGAGENDAVGQGGFEILERVDREIDPLVVQGLVNFLCEQSFATDIGERPVGHPIAGGADDLGLKGIGRVAECRTDLAQGREKHLGLPARERRSARADP